LTSSCRSRRPANLPGFATRNGCSARVWYALATGACVCLEVHPAPAAPRVPARLIWHGSVCGSADDFATRVLERTDAVRFVRKGQRVAIRLQIERRAAGLDASVSIEARGRAPLRRHIESPDCDDALDALALVVAIGVEARSASVRAASPARGAPPTTATPSEPVAGSGAVPAAELPSPEVPPVSAASAEPQAPTPPPSTVAASASPIAQTSPGQPLPPAIASLERRDPEVGAPVPAAAPTHFHFGAGISALMSFGIAPDPLLGGAVWVAMDWQGGGLWSPELVLSALHQRLDGLSIQSGAVDFALSAAAISICPLRLGSSVWQMRPCAAGSFGRLATEAYDTYDPRSSERPWAAVGGALELTAAIGIVELRATLGASAPLARDGYRFGGACSGAACEADVFHRVAPVIWSGAAGAGVRLW
jgi:hypothetical protein